MRPDLSCAEASRALGESLAGSAVSEADHWLLLHAPEAWGPSGLVDSGLDARVVARIEALQKRHARLRVQLIRRPGPVADVPPCILVRTGATPSAVAPAGGGAEALLELDLEAWLAGGVVPGADALSERIYLVCTHGKRDRCCAQRGMPVYSRLEATPGARVFQTTHLGGHRFAATLIVLPEGVCYGRVEPDEVAALVAAHAAGKLHDLSRMRGRVAYRSSVQAAEIFLRQRLGERGLSALRFVRVEAAPLGEKVVFRHALTATDHSVVVARRATAPLLKSCGQDPKPSVCFEES